MEKIIAIYDEDLTYATRLMDYINKKETGFEAAVFTREDSLAQYLKSRKLELLILGEGLTATNFPKENIKYILSLSDFREGDKLAPYPMIYKYQAAGELLTDILSFYARNENGNVGFGNEKLKVISIFTPVPGFSKLSFAWSLALNLSEKKKVLLLPLDLLPVPVISSEEVPKQALSEFIYYLKEENPDIILKMRSMLSNVNKLSYLSGLSSGLDLLSLNGEEAGRWLEEIKAQTDYEAVILYSGLYNEATVEVLRRSDICLSCMEDNFYENSVMKEWERQMDFIGALSPKHKFHRILLPVTESPEDGAYSIPELKQTEIWSLALQKAEEL